MSLNQLPDNPLTYMEDTAVRKAIENLIDKVEIEPVSYQEGRPYILLDGRLKFANNTLINIAIGRAAHEALGLNVAYVCFDEDADHYADKLYQTAGIQPLELGPYAQNQPIWFKLYAKLRAYAQAYAGVEPVLQMRVRGIKVGDLIYDTIKKSGTGIYTYEDASFTRVATTCESAIRAIRRELDIHRAWMCATLS